MALRPLFRGVSYLVFDGGSAFGILACADFAPSLLAPGRIEHLLSLPVRRWQLLAGTFLGTTILAALGAAYGTAGLTLIIGLKTGVWTARPLLAGLLAALVFAALDAATPCAAVFVRSAALSAATGGLLLVAGIVAGYRISLGRLFEAGVGRTSFLAVTAVLPRIPPSRIWPPATPPTSRSPVPTSAGSSPAPPSSPWPPSRSPPGASRGRTTRRLHGHPAPPPQLGALAPGRPRAPRPRGLAGWPRRPREAPAATTRPHFRHEMTPAEHKREQARLRTLPPAPVARKTAPEADGGPAPVPVPKAKPEDSLLVSLGSAQGAMVIEANALWNEPLGQMLLKCLKARDEDLRQALDESKKSFHLDPIPAGRPGGREHRRRHHPVGLLQGRRLRCHVPVPSQGPLWSGAVIYENIPGAGGDAVDSTVVAIWDDQLWLVGPDEDRLKQIIDQLEGRLPRPDPSMPPDDAYGDIYGSMPGWVIANAMKGANPALADRIRQTISGADFHLDAQGGAMLTADFYRDDSGGLEDLEKATAGALAAARLAAQAAGRPRVADFLDGAKLVPNPYGFSLDLAVPQSWLKDALGKCEISGRRPRAKARSTPSRSFGALARL